jgi:hypothetical protein
MCNIGPIGAYKWTENRIGNYQPGALSYWDDRDKLLFHLIIRMFV